LKHSSSPLLIVLASVACGAGSNPGAPTSDSTTTSMTTLSSPRAAVSLTVNPSPVVSTESGDPRAPREARWTIVLRDTGGVGSAVNFVNATLRDDETGVLADPRGVQSLSSSDVLAAAD